MGKGGETEKAPIADGTKGAREKRRQNHGADFENRRVEVRLGGDDQTQKTKQEAKHKSEWEVNETALECKRSNCGAGDAMHKDQKPYTELFGLFDNLIEAPRSLLHPHRVMHHLFVNFVRVAELAQIDTLSDFHEFDFSGMGLRIVERDNHASGNVEKLCFGL